MKQDYPSADYIRNNRVFFNIKCSDYGLIALMIYVSQKVYAR
ncbi:MAG: type II toxin-antitoxin system HigB family toxin [Bacteroidota bacterium]